MFRNSLKSTQVYPIYRGTIFLCSSAEAQTFRPGRARHQEQKFQFVSAITANLPKNNAVVLVDEIRTNRTNIVWRIGRIEYTSLAD